MNLWTAASYYLGVPNWKRHSYPCTGRCPKCDFLTYCATDAWAGLLVEYRARAEMTHKEIPEALYRTLLERAELNRLMSESGFAIDLQVAEEIDAHLGAKRAKLFTFSKEMRKDGKGEKKSGKKIYNAPFNPNAPGQVVEWFRGEGVVLKSAAKGDVLKALKKQLTRLGTTVEEFEQFEGDCPEVVEWLFKAFQFKSAGKEVKSWVNERVVTRVGERAYLHPRFIQAGTSMGRLAAASPNIMAFPRRGLLAGIRKAVVAREGKVLVGGDFSQIELRRVLHNAGVDPRGIDKDAFTWLVAQVRGEFDQPARERGMSARDIAKGVSHAGNYLEGLMWLNAAELASTVRVRERDKGALLVCGEWALFGRTACFTGANLAERLYGDKREESRRKALKIQEIYFNNFHAIREWQMRVTCDYLRRGYVRSCTGRYLQLWGDMNEQSKMICAFFGQGESADHVQAVMQRFWVERGMVPLFQVHDELIYERDAGLTRDGVREIMKLAEEETVMIPGFVCPMKFKLGCNWGELEEFS